MKTLRARIAGRLLGLVVATSLSLPAMAASEAGGPGKASGPRSGTVELASEQMRLIMGGTAGKGVLHFKGAGIGAKAVTSVSAAGDVYSLERVEDFAGKYTSSTRSAMAGSREVTASYTNDKGVELHLRGTVEGVGLSLGGGVATIELIKR